MIVDFLTRLEELDNIIRFSVRPKIINQSVSEHSFHVANIAWMLGVLENTMFSGDEHDTSNIRVAEVVVGALIHDLEEGVTGDIHGKFRREHPELSEQIDKVIDKELHDKVFEFLPEQLREFIDTDLSEREQEIIYMADKLDMLRYVEREKTLGNTNLDYIQHIAMQILSKSKLESVQYILDEVIERKGR